VRDSPRIGATKLLLVALHRRGRDLHRVPTGPGIGPEWVEREVRSFLARFDAPPASLGIAVPGLVSVEGVVTACDTFPRFEAFADLDCPVRALNDADAALVEETRDLAPDATVALVMAGTWIGAAVRANGVPLRGTRGWASSGSRPSRSRVVA
jgi:predicted NBD/HSP70 family sugar kinase